MVPASVAVEEEAVAVEAVEVAEGTTKKEGEVIAQEEEDVEVEVTSRTLRDIPATTRTLP